MIPMFAATLCVLLSLTAGTAYAGQIAGVAAELTQRVDIIPDHRQFYIAAATRADLAGTSAHGIPTWTITIPDGAGGWDRPSALPFPQSLIESAPAMRDKVALFQAESGLGGGWLLVPKGWRVAGAQAGAQGSWFVVFMAPAGSRGGRLLVGASGLDLGVINDMHEGRLFEELDSNLPSEEKLNACTGIVVRESAQSVHTEIHEFSAAGILRFSLDLPLADSAMRKFLVRAYLQSHEVKDCARFVRS